MLGKYADQSRCRGGLRRFCLLALGILVFLGHASAQDLRLTPQQQSMLDQLPQSQRAAALRQLSNLEQSKSRDQGKPAEGVGAVLPVIDPIEPKDEGPAVFLPGDTIVLSLKPRLGENAKVEPAPITENLGAMLRNGNPYTLDALGHLELPAVGKIPLAGLTEDQAKLRLNSDPLLWEFDFSVTRLPLRSVGIDALQPFGYELFRRGADLTYLNNTVPVDAEYVVGVGDIVHVQLFGNQNAEYEFQVDKNGIIRFPEIGPLAVAGLTYAAMQNLVRERVTEQFIGTQSSVTLGELRALQVFVVGDVRAPGSYAATPMSTITTALAQSGGIAEHGSLRNIQLKRGGKVIASLDVYDLLMRGDTRDDARLRAGDVVFVPPVGARVTVAGEVNRPAIYEYRGPATVADALNLAGGLKPSAFRRGVKIERSDPASGLRVIAADVTSEFGRKIRLRDGDTLIIPGGVSLLEDSIVVTGNVLRPGQFQWREGLRIADVLRSGRELKPGSDTNYVLIRREVDPNAGLDVVSADLQAAWTSPESIANVRIEPRDTIYVFDLEIGRAHVVDPLLDELRLRTSHKAPLPVVRVGGQVNAGGQYPIENGMRIADVVRAAGGLSQAAYLQEAELTRYEVVDGQFRETDLVKVNLDRALAGDVEANLLIRPFDYLNVKEIPRWRDQEFVDITGEVAFPGRYPIQQGETLTSVIGRAGGLTSLAFPRGSIFTREILKQREREQLDVLANRIESDLATMSLSDPAQAEASSVGQALLLQLRNAEPVGRLVVGLEAVLSGKHDDLLLRDGDALYVPTAAQEVTVLGEVQYSTSHLFDSTLSRDDYIQKSGGVTRKADTRRTYIVRASGEVVIPSGSRFFRRTRGIDVEPGDTIVVPLNTDRVKPITLWTSATQIIYNLAIAAAAVNSF